MSAGDDNGAIRITVREVYDAVRRMEDKITELLSQKDKVTDHETRIRTLEGKFVGVTVAAVSILLTGIGGVVWKVLAG